jgi:hypothetical protein
MGSEALAQTPPPLDQSGQWVGPFDLHSRCIHATLLRGVGTNHSRIVWWPEPGAHDHSGEVHSTFFWDWNPTPQGSVPPALPGSFGISTNALCAGHSVLATGDLFITGGTELGDVGIRETGLLTPGATAWQAGASMSLPRWYPTNTALADGNVFVSAGYKEPSTFVIGGHQGSTTFGSTSLLRMRHELDWESPDFNATSPGTRTLFSSIDMGQSWRSDGCSEDVNRFLTLLYGGERNQTTLLGDLWGLRWNREEDDYTWAELTTSEVGGTWPPALCRHTAVYDTLGRAMLIYGGIQSGGGPSSALYRLNNIHVKGTDCTASMTWELVNAVADSPNVAPPPLYGHNALYDGKHRRMILFGGRDATRYYNDVWLLNLAGGTPNWIGPLEQIGAPAPDGRAGAAAVWDTTHHTVADTLYSYKNNRILLLGGFKGPNNALTLVSDTLWSGTIVEDSIPKIQWHPLPPSHSNAICDSAEVAVRLNNSVSDPDDIPVARADASMVIEGDPYYRVLLYGGDTTPGVSGGEVADLWRLDLGPSTCSLGYLRWVRMDESAAGPSPGSRAGHAMVFDTRPRTALFPELYNATSKSMSTVTNGKQWLYSYPFMHLLANGEIFYSGVDTRTRRFNFSTGWETNPLDSEFYGDTSVLVPTSRGMQVMKCGQKVQPWVDDNSKKVGIIEFDEGETEGWVVDEMKFLPLDRQDGNLTILADGRVLLSGGVQNNFENDSTKVAIYRPLIWDPETKGWNVHAGGLLNVLSDSTEFRDYHSIALLLPDGSVFTAGGQDVNPRRADPNRRETGEIFYPPYLFDSSAVAVRPVIQAIDDVACYGMRFCLTVGGTAAVDRVTMVRPGSVTHGFNQDQRFVSVEIESTAVVGSDRVVYVGAPENGNLAPPGNYLVFAFRGETPSVAQWILLGRPQSGTLTQSATWSPEQGPHFLTGDLTIPSGKSLTLLPGTAIYTATPASRKIRVEGTLYSLGSAENPVQIGGHTSLNPTGEWEGIEVATDGALYLNHTRITNGWNGVRVPAYEGTQQGANDVLWIADCEFADNREQDILIKREPTITALTPALITISGCEFDVGSGANGQETMIGIELEGPMKGTVISGNTFYGTGGVGGSKSGVEFDHPGGASTPRIEGNTFSGFSVGQGLKLGGGAATVRGNTFSSSKYGVNVTAGTHVIAPALSTQLGNTFSSNGTAGAYIGGGSPRFHRNLFTGNYNGAISKNATPDFGTATNHGQNSFVSYTNKCLWNQSATTVMAKGNYWGIPCPDSTEILTCGVNINYFPALCSSPLSNPGRDVAVERVASSSAPLVSLTGTVVREDAEFSVTRTGTEDWTEFRVYDVLGRLRSLIPLSGQREGSERVNWKPVDRSGGRLPNGIYFGTVRSRSSETRGVRILVLQSGGGR